MIPAPEKKREDSSTPSIMSLSPGEREVLEALERNVSKIGFKTKMRLVYGAKRSAFNRGNVAAMMGVFRQFNTLHLNSFKPNFSTMTIGKFPFKKQREHIRKVKLLKNYRNRWLSTKPTAVNTEGMFVFNVEELATVYHFPGISTVAPSLPRIGAKKSEPPSTLPIM